MTAECWVCPERATKTCYKCSARVCPEHTRYYFDDSNIAITQNAKPECSMCFPPKYARPFAFARAVERGEWDV